jgi:hypothetical protein
MSLYGSFAAGTSSRAEGPSTAGPAVTTTCPAPEGGPGPDGQRCPYREHALISQQEHEDLGGTACLPRTAAARAERARDWD